MVPPIAPNSKALFPIFFPNTASPHAAPKTIWVIESTILKIPNFKETNFKNKVQYSKVIVQSSRSKVSGSSWSLVSNSHFSSFISHFFYLIS